LASRADSGGGGDGVVARVGLDDKGEEMAGRWAEGVDRLGGAWLAKSGKIGGRPIVVNMAHGEFGALRRWVWFKMEGASGSDHVVQSLLMACTFKC
jgi:hypothetical protein